jgi:hypothetical protein
VTEQLGRDQARGNGCAIDAHEWPACASRMTLNRGGDDFLADAGLAAQQHRRVGRRDLLGRTENAAQRLRGADQVGERGTFLAVVRCNGESHG